MLKTMWGRLFRDHGHHRHGVAADVSGKWSGQVPSRGEAMAATFTFKVDGDKLTGTMTGPQGEVSLQEGKVSGDQISFTTTGGNAKILFLQCRSKSISLRRNPPRGRVGDELQQLSTGNRGTLNRI